jgi:hypothetical protein
MKTVMVPMKWFVPMLICLAIGVGFSKPASAGFYLREELRPMWAKVDTNSDGYLSRDEICIEDPGMLREFDNADANHDGRLDLGEFEILLISL